MKKNKIKEKLLVALCGCIIGTSLGLLILYFRGKEPVEVIPVNPDSPIAMDNSTPNPNIVLTDEEQASLKKIQEDRKAEKNANTEKANGTGEYAEIVTSYDLAYAQQLAEETGTEMPDVTITMYAIKNSNIRETPSTDAPILGQYNKGDEVKVSFIENEWSKVELDDGKTGYVRNDLLANEKPVETPPANTQANNGSNNTESAGSETTGSGDNTAGGGTGENAGTENPPAGAAGGNASGGGAYTEEETQALRQQMLEAGAIEVGEFTPSSGVGHVDRETSVDISNVTLH